MDKIDIHNTEREYDNAILNLEKDISKVNFKLIIQYLNASAIGRTARKGASKKQAGKRTRQKNLFLLKRLAQFFDKPLNKMVIKDMEKLVKCLNEDKITKENGSKYSEYTKSHMKKTFISFLRYTIGENENFFKLTEWIETQAKKKDIPALSEEEVLKMLDHCNNLQQRFLVAFLFDSGCRIEEFLNIRLEDVAEVEGDVPYYRVTIKEEFSKTKGRTISLLWKETYPIMKQWLKIMSEMSLKDPIYLSNYDNTRITLQRIGKRALSKKTNPHLMRHSSATFYASKRLTYAQLCNRFGWAIGSNVPQVYIDKSGIEEEKVVREFKEDNIEGLRIQIKQLENANKFMTDKMNQVMEFITFKNDELENSDNPDPLEANEQIVDEVVEVMKK